MRANLTHLAAPRKCTKHPSKDQTAFRLEPVTTPIHVFFNFPDIFQSSSRRWSPDKIAGEARKRSAHAHVHTFSTYGEVGWLAQASVAMTGGLFQNRTVDSWCISTVSPHLQVNQARVPATREGGPVHVSKWLASRTCTRIYLPVPLSNTSVDVATFMPGMQV